MAQCYTFSSRQEQQKGVIYLGFAFWVAETSLRKFQQVPGPAQLSQTALNFYFY